MRGPGPGVPPRGGRLQGQVVRVRLPQLHRGGPLRRRRLPRGGALGHGGGARAHGAGGGGDTQAEVKKLTTVWHILFFLKVAD